ncbi:bifunctional non-homologous end joining protein LigD [Rhizobiales bacterium GAS113]|nr:bifunctional non-homologous end joining protein LigD [Rhizobiales bacterium GAS113]
MSRPSKKLAEYRAKRSFAKTSEPRGEQEDPRGGLYVIQKHDASRLHYDFRLELDGTLKSWVVTRGPSLDPSEKRLAVRVEDHPIEYADFEGTIPEGNYGAGTVIIWDLGSWEPIGDPHKGLKQGKLIFELRGERLKGRWALVRMRAKRDEKQRSEKRENWLLIKELDEHADREHDVLRLFTDSVKTGRDLASVAAGEAPKPARKR